LRSPSSGSSGAPDPALDGRVRLYMGPRLGAPGNEDHLSLRTDDETSDRLTPTSSGARALAADSPSLRLVAFLVAVVVIVAGVGIGLLYEYNHPKAPAAPLTVAVGDNVTVNYIGLFGSGPEQGKIFDTSIRSVASDNATYPKSLEYTPRNVSGYTPLPVHVGPNTPGSGYNVSGVSYLGVVTGFWKGLLGLAVNQTRWVTVPANVGYGSLNPSCLVTAPLVETIPLEFTVTPSQFASVYPFAPAATGASFVDPTYGWTDLVLSANSSAVVVAHEPYVGETTNPYGWSVTVTAVTSQNVTLENDLTPSSPGHVLGKIPGTTVCSTTSFLVWSVDPTASTFVKNYNREVVGVTLVFVVTVTTILTP
jgi:hypothetical protein